MKAEDLGINPKTGAHDRRLTHVEETFVGILWDDHVGSKNAIGADELALQLLYYLEDEIPPDEPEGIAEAIEYYRENKVLEETKRDVRRLHNHLLTKHDRLPILSRSGIGGGYWVAESDEEAEQFYAAFRQRGMTGLLKASRGKQAVMADIVQQLAFEFDDLVDATGSPVPTLRRTEMSMPIQIVDQFLDQMSRDPERYADGLRRIGQKFGSVLLPKSRVAEIRDKAAQLQALVGDIF